MIFINEWMPNPAGPEVKGEFVELFNNGAAPEDLDGWKLATKNKKRFSLSGHRIAAGGYPVIHWSETKLALKNNDEELSLYGAGGQRVDQSDFLGAAPEGKSFNRVNYGTDGSQHFAFRNPTPGSANDASLRVKISTSRFPFNIPVNQTSINGIQYASLLAGAAVLITGLVMYAIQKNEDLSQLFFQRN